MLCTKIYTQKRFFHENYGLLRFYSPQVGCYLRFLASTFSDHHEAGEERVGKQLLVMTLTRDEG